MSKIGFPSNPNNGRLYTWRNRRKFNFDSTRGGWTASGGAFESGAPALNANTSIEDFNDSNNLAARLKGQAQVFNTYADLPTQNDGIGFAFVLETNKLYYWDQPGVIASFKVQAPYRFYRISYDGGNTWIYHQGALSQNTRMQNQEYTGYPGLGGTYPSDLGEYAVTTGNTISDDPTTARYITWTAPATTTYTITSTQASGVRTSSSSPSARKMTHKWNVTVPTGGKLYLSGGQSAAKYWASLNQTSNQNQPQYNNYTGAPGGTSQILLYDPSVSSGTLLDDGNRVNCILSIPGQSHSSSQEATNLSPTTSISINTTNGLETINVQGHNRQPVGQVHIATYGGYPRTTNYNVYYHTNYVTPQNDWDGAETGTNYSFGGIAGTNGGSGGSFVIEDGIVAD